MRMRTVSLLLVGGLGLVGCSPDHLGAPWIPDQSLTNAGGEVSPGWHISMNQPPPTERAQLTALTEGTVLLAGGQNGVTLGSASVFDRTTLEWTAVDPMLQARRDFAAVELGPGVVLAIGGAQDLEDEGTRELATVERFESGHWQPLASLHGPRSFHTATVLSDGRVLVAGGVHSGALLASAELYDPATDAWSVLAPMHHPRAEHTATVLADGRVLVLGGDDGGASAELFDPDAGTWTDAADMPVPRLLHVAARLPSGRVLVTSGAGSDGLTTELFDPGENAWLPAPPPTVRRIHAQGVTLRNGSVALVGGENDHGYPIATAEAFDESFGGWLRLGDLAFPRSGFFSVAGLGDGGAVVVGPLDGDTWAEFLVAATP